MNVVVHAKAASRHLLSGNEAVARAAWEAGAVERPLPLPAVAAAIAALCARGPGAER